MSGGTVGLYEGTSVTIATWGLGIQKTVPQNTHKFRPPHLNIRLPALI